MQKLKILYIEDTEYWRELVAENFKKAGIEIKTLPDARGNIINEAVEYRPDLILLDISMPEVSGFDAIQILKNNEQTKNIPVFFFSALSGSSTIKKGLELGAERYLVKGDFEVEEIVRTCLDYLSK